MQDSQHSLMTWLRMSMCCRGMHLGFRVYLCYDAALMNEADTTWVLQQLRGSGWIIATFCNRPCKQWSRMAWALRGFRLAPSISMHCFRGRYTSGTLGTNRPARHTTCAHSSLCSVQVLQCGQMPGMTCRMMCSVEFSSMTSFCWLLGITDLNNMQCDLSTKVGQLLTAICELVVVV